MPSEDHWYNTFQNVYVNTSDLDCTLNSVLESEQNLLVILLMITQVLERLNEIQKEVMITVQELNKSQKLYREEQHEAHEAKVKATNVDAK